MPQSAPRLRIHVVSLQVPFPPDYGGVIDIYYKLKAFRAAGYEVYLHTYQYDRQRAPPVLHVVATCCTGAYGNPRGAVACLSVATMQQRMQRDISG